MWGSNEFHLHLEVVCMNWRQKGREAYADKMKEMMLFSCELSVFFKGLPFHFSHLEKKIE